MEALGIKWIPELRNIADLKKWDKNPRKISDVAYANLKAKVIEEGMHQVLTVDADNTVLSGNQRLQILTELEIPQVWCMFPERPLTPEERDKVGIQSNLNDGMWDVEILSKQFDIPMLKDFGFTSIQLGVKAQDAGESDSRHEAKCPHCGGGLRLSNRVKKIERI